MFQDFLMHNFSNNNFQKYKMWFPNNFYPVLSLNYVKEIRVVTLVGKDVKDGKYFFWNLDVKYELEIWM